jgi:hypothetical protein
MQVEGFELYTDISTLIKEIGKFPTMSNVILVLIECINCNPSSWLEVSKWYPILSPHMALVIFDVDYCTLRARNPRCLLQYVADVVMCTGDVEMLSRCADVTVTNVQPNIILTHLRDDPLPLKPQRWYTKLQSHLAWFWRKLGSKDMTITRYKFYERADLYPHWPLEKVN